MNEWNSIICEKCGVECDLSIAVFAPDAKVYCDDCGAVVCRKTPGKCFCGCHISDVMKGQKYEDPCAFGHE